MVRVECDRQGTESELSFWYNDRYVVTDANN
jgi:hypothetical protein